MKFIQYDTHSAYYQQSLKLRQLVLRKPLGLDLYQQDLSGEAGYWHFGIIDNNELDNNELVACLIIVPESGQQVSLKQMAVSPQCQGQQLGRRLIESTENHLKHQDIKTIKLSAREHALGFYHKLGYRAQGPTYIEVTIVHQLMFKTIN